MNMGAWLEYLNELETPVCLAWNRSTERRWVRQPFALISRLGDGLFWYSLMIALPLASGWAGARASLHMLVTGLVALALYKSLKGATRRARPCNRAPGVTARVPPLDIFSFPSGHTLHAVAFTTVALHYYPDLAWILVPFTLLVASSRVVLGLHYPSDVLVAAAIGSALGRSGIELLG
jgi:undecaprenyl-diphosphatase